jgi:hypothetical protein
MDRLVGDVEQERPAVVAAQEVQRVLVEDVREVALPRQSLPVDVELRVEVAPTNAVS